MTAPHNPEAPEVVLADVVPAAAGSAAAVPVTVHHRGRRPARIRVTIFGLDSRWVPQPLDLGILQPGDSAAIKLSILPERGALGARYPFTIAAEASALDGRTRPVVGVAESVLALDSAERISMAIVPSTPSGAFSKGFRVEITNPGGAERTFTLVPDSANGIRTRLAASTVTVPPERTVAVKGRVHVKKPTFFGGHNTHTFTVAAQGTGAPEWAEATMRSKPLIGRGITAVVGLILVVAMWATLAIVFIPKISDAFKPKNEASVSSTVQGSGTGDGTSSGSPDGSPEGNGSGNGNGNGSGNGSGSGTGNGTGNGTSPAGGYQLSGTVTGSGANGATVTLAPVSLASAGDDGSLPAAQTAGENPNALRGQSRAFAAATPQDDPVGKIPGPLAGVAPGGFRTTTILTTEKGEFAFSGVTAPGFYLLTIAKAGYQTQRFLINSVTLASPQPLKVELQPGAGKLSGTVTGPGGAPLGAATIVVTDGTVTLQTSSVSASTHSGTPGTWTMDQVSTPGTYLVTASSPGLGAASTLVTLDASGAATVNLTLHAGQASITGTVSGADSLGNVGGLGGITVTATGGDVTRTTTTVTSAAMRGAYVLPNLPTPGTYTIAITGPGFLAQTREVTLAAGSGNVVIDATLTRADAVVTGRVTGLDANGKAEGGLGGVGLTLASNDITLKTVSTSGGTAGSFQFTGVAPGSYVLTAVQFGRTAASATVEVKAAATQTVNLVLSADIGAELPATAHIRGQVADSRTGGPLTCDRALQTVASSDCVATVTVTAPKDPADESKGTVTYTTKATAALNFVYTIPDLDDPDHAGLPPGLYTVTVSAPGYEDTVTHVQVAEGQTVPAPPASMPALGIISGTVTTRVGTPAKASCVLAVPVGVTLPKTLPTSCTVATDGNTCTATGITGAQPCALTSMGGANEAPLGTFQVPGLTHGRYQMVLISQDPEYVYTVGAVPIVTLELGADGQFNAVLDRLGRINVSVQKINSATGQLEPVPGATLTTAKGSGADTAWPTATDASGRALITKLVADTYTVKATSGTITVSDTATISGLNQSVDLTLVIAEYQGPLVGRITTTGDNNSPIPIAGATVTLTGVVGYQGSTERIGYAKVTTDGNGCYAIVPKDWVEANGTGKLKSADCPTALTATITSNGAGTTSQLLDLSTNQAATLITERLSVAVAATGNTQTYPATAATIVDCPAGNADCSTDPTVRMIPATIVTATPKPISSLILRVAGPSGGFTPAPSASDVHINVISKPPLAQGVLVGADGSFVALSPSPPIDGVASTVYSVPLTFSDSQFTSQNLALPGTYKLQVSLDGFVTQTADLVCAFANSTCSGTVTLKRLPSISVDIDAPSPAVTAWGSSTVQQTAGPNLGTITVAGDDTTHGHLMFGSSATRLASSNTDYSFLITVPGYGPMTASVSCGADYSTASPSCKATAEPTALPDFPTADVTVELDPSLAPGTTTPQLSTGSVTATISPNPNSVISISVTDQGDGTGTVSWTDHRAGINPGQVTPVDGGYTITYSRAGFVPATATLTCTTTGTPTCTQIPAAVTLKMLPQPQVKVTLDLPTSMTTGTVIDLANRNVQFRVYKNPGTGQTLVSTAHLTLGSVTVDSGGTTASGTAIWNDTTQPFAGIAAAGTYAVTASLDGYQEKTTNSFTCTEGTADCTAGSVTLATNPAQSSADLAVQKFPWTDTHVQFIVTGPSGVALATLTEGTKDNSGSRPVGMLTWQQGNAPANVVTPGDYQITAVLNGYESTLVNSSDKATLTNPITFHCTTDAGGCTLPKIAMVAPTTLNVVATGATDAKITLKRTGGAQSIVATADGTATFTNLSTSSLDTTAGADGSYTLDVHAAGYEFADGLNSGSTAVVCTNPGSNGPATGLNLIPGGTTTCTVTLTKLGAIGGTTWWQQQHLDTGFTAAAKAAQPYVTVTAQKVSGSTATGPVFTVTSASDGSFSLTGTKDNEGLARDTTWRITATATGFATLTGDVKLNNDDTLVISGTPTGGALSLSTDSKSLSIEMLATKVKLDLVFKDNGAQVNVPAGIFTLAEAGTPANTWACTVPATGAPTSSPTSTCAFTGATGSPSTQKLQYAALPPGSYLLSMNFAAGSPYTDVANRGVTVEPSGVEQEVPFDLAAQVATLQGALKDSTGAAITSFPGGNVTVTLKPWPCPATGPCIAKKFDGSDATDSTVTSSTFTMTNLPEGWFTLEVKAPGYVTVETPNFFLTRGFTTPQSVTLVPTAATSVKLALTLHTGTAADDDVLVGATVTMTPTGTQPRQKANTATFTSGAIPADSTSHKAIATITGTIPSGEYSITLNPANAAIPFPLDAGSVTVTDAQNATLADFSGTANSLNAAPVTLTVDWSSLSVDCVATPANGTDIQLSLSKTVGGTPSPANPQPTAKVNTTTNKAASDTLYLPPGAYSWTPTLTGLTGWSATATSLTVADPAVTPTTGISVTPTITAVTNFTATYEVDGTATAGASIVATDTSSATVTLTDNGDGSYTACLPGAASPGHTWTVSVNSPNATTPILGFGDVTVTVTNTTAAPASTQFAGYTLSPSVVLAGTQTGHDSVTADLSITGLGWSAAGTTIPSAGWSKSFIAPAGDYTFGAVLASGQDDWTVSGDGGVTLPLVSLATQPKLTITYTAPSPHTVSPTVSLDSTGATPDAATVFTVTLGTDGSFTGKFTGSTWTDGTSVSLAAGTYVASAVSATAGTATITGSFKVGADGSISDNDLTIKYTNP